MNIFHRFGDRLFGLLGNGVASASASAVLGDYKKALDFGKENGDCGQRFSSCPFDGQDMMAMISDVRRL